MKKGNVVLNDLFDYGLKIYQNNNNFKFSLDSILLAEFVKLTTKTKNILDLCTGNASIPLILSTKTNSIIDAFEIQDSIYELAKESINFNNLNKQIKVYNENVLNINNIVNNKKYDIITCNPPYFKVNEAGLINEVDELAIARHELKITLEDIFKISSSHLDDGGELYMIHRASRIDEIIILANKYNLNVKKIVFIKTSKEEKPYLVLVKCKKKSRFGVVVENTINVEGLTTYKNLFKEVV